MVKTRSGLGFGEWVIISLKLTCYKALTDDGIRSRIRIEHKINVGWKVVKRFDLNNYWVYKFDI